MLGWTNRSLHCRWSPYYQTLRSGPQVHAKVTRFGSINLCSQQPDTSLTLRCDGSSVSIVPVAARPGCDRAPYLQTRPCVDFTGIFNSPVKIIHPRLQATSGIGFPSRRPLANTMATQIHTSNGQTNTRWVRLCLFTTLLCATPVLANMRTAKLRVWFPTDGEQWDEIARGPCADSIAAFHAGDRTHTPAPCAAALSCILDHTSESGKSNLANAQVVLGLTPTILSLVGSNVAELAVVGWRRPWLTMLLALGAPALQMQSFFTVLEATPILAPRGVLEGERRSSVMAGYREWLNKCRRGGLGGQVMASLCAIAPYILALASIANNITTSLYLDLRSVVGFRCGAVYMPLAWGLLGIFPALFAMLAAWRQYGFYRPALWPVPTRNTQSDQHVDNDWRSFARGSLSGQHRRRPQWWSAVLFSAAALAAILQLIYGTALLSAMTPIFFFDALPIITRYAASTIVCRAVLLVELEMMHLELHEGDGKNTTCNGHIDAIRTLATAAESDRLQQPISRGVRHPAYTL